MEPVLSKAGRISETVDAFQIHSHKTRITETRAPKSPNNWTKALPIYIWPKGPSSYPRSIIMLYPFRNTFPLSAVPSVPFGSPVGTSVLWMAISWLSWNIPLVHGLLFSSGVAAFKFHFPVSVSVTLDLLTVIWWPVRFPLLAAVAKFVSRSSMSWLSILLILCPVIGFSLSWRQCLPVGICLFSFISLLLLAAQHFF